MKALIAVTLITLATVSGVTASQAAPSNSDVCESTTLSVHGVWDCR